MKGFIDFIREQGVVGLAVGFILGGAISQLVAAIVRDVINPLIGIVIGPTSKLADASFQIYTAKILYGDLISVLVNFIVIALVVYFGVKMIGLDKLDKKKA
ncbi:MAG: MscL family protein [Candidatus Paceibacterota bacterium]